MFTLRCHVCACAWATAPCRITPLLTMPGAKGVCHAWLVRAQTSQTKGTQRVKGASDETAAFIHTVATFTPQLLLLTSLQHLPVFVTAEPWPELLPNFPQGMPIGHPLFRPAEFFSDRNILGWICMIFRLEISATQLLFTVNNNCRTDMSSAVLAINCFWSVCRKKK